MGVLSAVLGVACLATLAAALGVASATDLSCRIIPNGCVLAVACSGVVRALARALANGSAMALVAEALLGGLSVLGVMLLAAALSTRGGGRPGVGGGDVKLLAAVGVWTGPLVGLATVALSCLVGVLLWGLGRIPERVRAGEGPSEKGGGHRPRKVLSEGIPLAPAVTAVTVAVVLSGLVVPP